MLFFHKLPNCLKVWVIKRNLCSREMRLYEKGYPVTDEQRRWLTFGAVLFTQNIDSCRTLKSTYPQAAIKESISDWWDINNREEALETVWRLSAAEVHTPFADDVYRTLVRQGNVGLQAPMSLPHISWLENAYQRTAERMLDSLMDVYKAEKEQLSKNEIENPGDRNSAKQYIQDLVEKIDEILKRTDADSGNPLNAKDILMELGYTEEDIITEMNANMDYGLENYRAARKVLTKLGYTENELSRVRTTAAWDYGRTPKIARDSFLIGYITESEAWEFMKTAAESAEKLYSGWREYSAGYVLGRAIGYGNDSRDIYAALYYLLKNRHSPFNEIEFR